MSDVLHTQALTAALAAEFGAAIEAALGRPLTVAAAPAAPGPGWQTTISASGALIGTLTAAIDTAGARAIATQMMRLEEEPEESVVADMLRELWGRAAAASALKDGFEGLTLAAGTPVAGELESGASGWMLQVGVTTLGTVTMTGQVAPGVAAGTPSLAPGDPATAGASSPGNLAALLDIDLPLVVRFARTELSLRALTMLGPGSLVDMGRSPDDPVQLLVGSQVIAEGEVVVVAGNYGVRITSLVSPAERLRAMDL